MEYCNKNQYGLSFTFVTNSNTLPFLDLELGHDEVTSTIVSKNYIKSTAVNSYLLYNSCHNPKWINNIPKGQFCRLRQNCTRENDYVDQSLLLKKKFKDKDYPEAHVDQAFQYYLKGKPPKVSHEQNNYTARFITIFHCNFKKMENILKRH